MLTFLQPSAFAALRIVAGFLFTLHGLQKLFGWLGGRQVELASQFGVAGVLETVGGPLIALGLWTQPVAFLLSGEMAVAYFQAHHPRSVWPIQNGGELAALYSFLFLYFSVVGAGRFSLDGLRRTKR
jgi:putative oxidoreductase